MMSIGLPCDQVGGQNRFDRRNDFGRQFGKLPLEIRQRIDRHHAGAAAVGDDHQTVARHTRTRATAFRWRRRSRRDRWRAECPQRSKRGVIDRIDAGKRAGVRGRRFRRRVAAPGLDGDDGLDARRRARRGHEFARVEGRVIAST